MRSLSLLILVMVVTLAMTISCVTPPPLTAPPPAGGTPPASSASAGSPPAANPSGSLKFEFVSVTDPATKGDAMTVKGKTAPGAECTLAMTYSDGSAATIPGLADKTVVAGADGNAAWTWPLFSRTPSGKTTFTVTTKKGNETGTASTTFMVK